MNSSILLHDRRFVPYLSPQQISTAVASMARKIDADYAGRNPLCLAILNGAFVFAADLFRALTIPAEIAFIRLSSYAGTSTSGKVSMPVGLGEDPAGRHVLILEDIVDTGVTLDAFLPVLAALQPASIAVAALLDKPAARRTPLRPDYYGLEIPDLFVVGYGLDYNGMGRGLPAIYQLAPGS